VVTLSGTLHCESAGFTFFSKAAEVIPMQEKKEKGSRGKDIEPHLRKLTLHDCLGPFMDADHLDSF
jgi:hypothetical protein